MLRMVAFTTHSSSEPSGGGGGLRVSDSWRGAWEIGKAPFFCHPNDSN